MLSFAFEAVSKGRKGLQGRINKQEGLQLARQEKNDQEIENANATYQKKFDEQMDLLIKQLETKRDNGTPEEAKVSEIFHEDGENFRADAESAIMREIHMTMQRVSEAKEELDLEEITNFDNSQAEITMETLASTLQSSMKQQNREWVDNYKKHNKD